MNMSNSTLHDKMDHISHNDPAPTGGHHAQAYFFFSVQQQILFKNWMTNDAKDIGLACLYITLIAVAYEGLKVTREYISRYQLKCARNSIEKKSRAVWFCLHFLQTQLHMVQITASFFLMLVFMTFNVYLCISVVAGIGVGYFLFGWKRVTTQDVNEHCN